MTTTVEKMYSNTDYPSVNGLVMAETTTHLLIDATHGGTKMVESLLKFIVRKSDGYWIKIGWNDPMNDPSNYEEGYDIIKLFLRQFGQPAEYYFYAFYGRRGLEASELEKNENPKIKEILSKRFSSKKEMVEFLSYYVNEEFSFKDIGINNTHGGGIVSAHSVKQLLQKISQK